MLYFNVPSISEDKDIGTLLGQKERPRSLFLFTVSCKLLKKRYQLLLQLLPSVGHVQHHPAFQNHIVPVLQEIGNLVNTFSA